MTFELNSQESKGVSHVDIGRPFQTWDKAGAKAVMRKFT